jgi:DNA polymerase III delta prime subunit
MSDLDDLVWEQKYRPRKIDDTILPDDTKKTLKKIIADGNFQNFLFAGSHGIGKTTTAMAIADEIGADVLFVNASMAGNIDTLRTDVTQFVTSVSFTGSKKIVIFDEADYMNAQSTQPSLRGFMDEFSKNAIFIFTCNNKSRLIKPIRDSRLETINFKFTKEEKQSAAIQMLKRCCEILDIEGVTYDKKSVAGVVSKNFPDFRKTLNQLQFYSNSGAIDSGILAIVVDDIDDLVKVVKAKDFAGCRKWCANNSMDASTFYRTLYDKMLPLLVAQTVPQVILHINDFQYQATSAVDPEINQIAFLINLMATAQFK